jgi:HD superfamily phosphodiesterase
MKIAEIYTKYKILPFLQLHMVRVAAVSSILCSHTSLPVDKLTCIKTALLHDIGNIVKFNLDIFPSAYEPRGISYWQGVKEEFMLNYGANKHIASVKIGTAIGVSARILFLIENIEFSSASKNISLYDAELNILQYADSRVNPEGIVSLEERLVSGNKRFLARNKGSTNQAKIFKENSNALYLIEQELFQKCTISPKKITNEAVNRILKDKPFDKIDF